MVGQTRPPARHRRDARKLESCRKRPGSHSTCHGKRNSYGTTLFGDGVRFEAFRAFGGGRKLMETLKSGEAFLARPRVAVDGDRSRAAPGVSGITAPRRRGGLAVGPVRAARRGVARPLRFYCHNSPPWQKRGLLRLLS